MSGEILEHIELETGNEPSATVIWLHGLGADGHDFEPIVPLLELPDELAVRFVFPHAPEREVTINNGVRMRAWYDMNPSQGPNSGDANIKESALQIEALLEREIERGLSSRRLINALKVLRGHYDRIIIDTPPILPVSDALVLAKHADAVIFVTKCDATSIKHINQGLDLLLRINARVIGIVVNQLDLRKAEKYSDYGYGGYYESYESKTAAG